jgi:hypothetical protein
MIQTMPRGAGIGRHHAVGAGVRLFVWTSRQENPADLPTFHQSEFVERDGMQLKRRAAQRPGFNDFARPPARSSLLTGTASPRSSKGDLLARSQHEITISMVLFVDPAGLQSDMILKV